MNISIYDRVSSTNALPIMHCESISEAQAQLANLMRTVCIIGAAITFISILCQIWLGEFDRIMIHALTLAVLSVVWLVPVTFKQRMGLLICFNYGVAVYFELLPATHGLGHDLFYLCCIIVASSCGMRRGLIMSAICSLTYGAILCLLNMGLIPTMTLELTSGYIVAAVIDLYTISAIIVVFFSYFIRKINQALDKERRLTEELKQSLALQEQLSNSLKKALAEERELNATRTRLVETVTHEFRTPLTVIKTSSTLLHSYFDRLSAEKRALHFAHIFRSIERLVQLTDKIVTPTDREADVFVQGLTQTDPIPRVSPTLGGGSCLHLIERK